MPYVRVDPEMYLEHQGVQVFHVYRAGTSEPWTFWFTTNPDDSDDEGSESHFDARMFAGIWETTPTVGAWEEFWKPRFKTEDEAVTALIRTAIETGRVTALTAGKGIEK